MNRLSGECLLLEVVLNRFYRNPSKGTDIHQPQNGLLGYTLGLLDLPYAVRLFTFVISQADRFLKQVSRRDSNPIPCAYRWITNLIPEGSVDPRFEIIQERFMHVLQFTSFGEVLSRGELFLLDRLVQPLQTDESSPLFFYSFFFQDW